MARRRLTGIEIRHGRTCATRAGGACDCKPSYQANVWSARDGKRIRKTFPTSAAAQSWRADALVGLRRGTLRTPSRRTLREAAKELTEGMKSGLVRTRSGDPYKPSVIRAYTTALDKRVLPDFGGTRLSEIRRTDVQDLADRLLAEGLDASTIRNTLLPLRVIYRRAVARGEVAVNPTSGLELPAVRGRRERIASPAEAKTLLDALSDDDRAVWATALYAGLRRGELLALRWEDVDLGAGVIRVERSWDVLEGAIETKSRAGRRTVPIASVLREHLIAHKLRAGRSDGLVFGRTAERPFAPESLRERALAAWKTMNEKREKDELEPLAPIGLHECRHTFASLMIAAGVNAKALCGYMGHASITITLDRYGHLFPGNEDEAAALLDRYLERAGEKARAVAGV